MKSLPTLLMCGYEADAMEVLGAIGFSNWEGDEFQQWWAAIVTRKSRHSIELPAGPFHLLPMIPSFTRVRVSPHRLPTHRVSFRGTPQGGVPVSEPPHNLLGIIVRAGIGVNRGGGGLLTFVPGPHQDGPASDV